MKYPLPLRLLHWSMALLIITLIVMGFVMTNSDAMASEYSLYPMHEAIGFITLILFLIRFPTRLKSTVPEAAAGLKKWEIKLSHTVHILLYASMFTMVTSGYLMISTYSELQGLDMFGLFTVPDLTSKNDYWSEIFQFIHGISAYVVTGAVLLHLAGVIKHRYLDSAGHDVLKRMV